MSPELAIQQHFRNQLLSDLRQEAARRKRERRRVDLDALVDAVLTPAVFLLGCVLGVLRWTAAAMFLVLAVVAIPVLLLAGAAGLGYVIELVGDLAARIGLLSSF